MVIYNNSIEFREKMKNTQEYILALKEERQKIQVFECELPLCLELVSQAIERCRHQMIGTITDHSSGEGPVLEEFIPIKPTYLSTNNDDDNNNVDGEQQLVSNKSSSVYLKKSDWLTSAQFSIQTQDPPIEKNLLSENPLDMDGNNISQKKKNSGSSSTDTDGDGSEGENKGQSNTSNKKERRCWSPELHRRFLHVLQKLGGAYAATPKQIKELMKVDGLTNDEIKSHLQKYRLHTRRLNHHNNVHTPQLVVVGRIWMPPLEDTANIAAASSSISDDAQTTLYCPIATLPTPLYKSKQLKNQESHSIG